ncbi:phage terminase large subunit [Micromonospora carbonacea]|uniref:phage terminase large subunit n=1 Tax=Micromonospora carbonacea TaxID=47853 RepID=UPI00159F26D3|nr:phage terminase large subunit [Micromonospora carbonacea]
MKLAKLVELRRLKAEKEQRRTAEARRKVDANRRRWPSPLDMATSLDPPRLDENGERVGVWRTPALELINTALVDLAEGRETRFAAFMSPQEGKSTTVSFWFPLWLLTCVNPDLRVLIVSYSDEMARRWGGEIKDALERWSGDEGTVDLGLRLRKDSRAAGRWNIAGHRGSVYCAGINGSITGKAGDVILVDDPLKNMAEAQSEKIRDKAMSVYQSAMVPRLGPGARMAWIQTCWHESEPIRQILANEGDRKNGGRWRVVSIPAVAEDDNDVLGRKAGEGMISARGDRDWKAIRKAVGEYVFAALYQQRPAPAEGNLFKRIWWRYWSPQPGGMLSLGMRSFRLADCWRFATVDLAASTKTSADWTVISAWARTISGDLVLLDRVRARIGEADHFAHALPLVERWQLDTLFVEATQHGMTLVREAANAGIPITPLQAEQDKLTRALPASAWCSNGRVWLPAGAWWVKSWVDECAAFPNGAHDDQVDTLAYAVRVAITRAAPAPPPPSRADPPELDLESVPL